MAIQLVVTPREWFWLSKRCRCTPCSFTSWILDHHLDRPVAGLLCALAVLKIASSPVCRQTDEYTDSSAAGLLDLLHPPAPRHPGAAAEQGDRYRPAAGVDRLELRVLVAEDNVVNRALLVRQLEELGCAVSTCGDGLDVLENLSASSLDVLLTDMNMPNMDGYELVRTLRSRGTNLPIIGNRKRDAVRAGARYGPWVGCVDHQADRSIYPV